MLRRLACLLAALPAIVVALPSAATAAREAAPAPAVRIPPPGAGQYVALAPTRLADTRSFPGTPAYGFTRIDAHTITVDITHRDGVSPDATTAVLNVTLAGASGPSYLSVYPSGEAQPTTSSLNADAAGRVIANMVHVKIGADGAVAIYLSASGGIAVDLVGVYVPVATEVAAGRLVTIPTGAARVYDSRDTHSPLGADSWRDVDVSVAGVPADAAAVVVSLTAVNVPVGFWTVYPSGTDLPATSTVNVDGSGQYRPGQAIVPLSDAGASIRVYSLTGGDFLVDVVGWFTGASAEPHTDGLFVPTSPQRLFDTRELISLPPWSNSTYEFGVGSPGFKVSAVALNVTATGPWWVGYVTAFPAGVVRPTASNLNMYAWPQTVAGHAIVRTSARGVSLYTYGGTHLLADLAGWYVGSPTPTTEPLPDNPLFLAKDPVVLYVPKLNLFAQVKAGSNLEALADSNAAATYPGTIIPARGNTLLYGHRTSYAHIFYALDHLAVGDVFYIQTSDLHWYTYVVVAETVTAPDYDAIQHLADPYGPVTAQLVTCSTATGTPGGTKYRLVITARLTAAA